jgi:hypothetical protein
MTSRFRFLRSGIPFVLLACGLLLSTAVAGASPTAAEDASATLTVLEGSVTVVAASTGEPHGGWSGESLFEGDRVTTGVPGGALITFLDGSELELDAGTEVELTLLQNGTDGGVVRVISQLAGVTINRVEHLGSDSTYQLQTPNVTAVVRGTVFLGRVERDEAVGDVLEESIALEEGWVDVRSGDQEERLHPGQRARVRRAEGDPPPGQERTLDVEHGTILTSKESGEQGGRPSEPDDSVSHGKSKDSHDQSDALTDKDNAAQVPNSPNPGSNNGNDGPGGGQSGGDDEDTNASGDDSNGGGSGNSGDSDDGHGDDDDGGEDNRDGNDNSGGGNDNSGGDGNDNSGKD